MELPMELLTGGCPCYARVENRVEGQVLQKPTKGSGEAKPHGQRKIQLSAGHTMLHVMIRDLNLFHGCEYGD